MVYKLPKNYGAGAFLQGLSGGLGQGFAMGDRLAERSEDKKRRKEEDELRKQIEASRANADLERSYRIEARDYEQQRSNRAREGNAAQRELNRLSDAEQSRVATAKRNEDIAKRHVETEAGKQGRFDARQAERVSSSNRSMALRRLVAVEQLIGKASEAGSKFEDSERAELMAEREALRKQLEVGDEQPSPEAQPAASPQVPQVQPQQSKPTVDDQFAKMQMLDRYINQVGGWARAEGPMRPGEREDLQAQQGRLVAAKERRMQEMMGSDEQTALPSQAKPSSSPGPFSMVNDSIARSMADRMLDVIGGIESGGGKSTNHLRPAGRSDVAVGKYGHMANYIPGRTKQYLGREMSADEFGADEKAQDEVSRQMLTEYIREGLNRGLDQNNAVRYAAAKWYSGNGDRHNDPNKQRAFGADGAPVEMPSVRDYADKAGGRFAAGGAISPMAEYSQPTQQPQPEASRQLPPVASGPPSALARIRSLVGPAKEFAKSQVDRISGYFGPGGAEKAMGELSDVGADVALAGAVPGLALPYALLGDQVPGTTAYRIRNKQDTGQALPLAGGTVGALGGPVGVAAGTAIGEGLRDAIQGKDVDVGKALVAGALGGVGTKLGGRLGSAGKTTPKKLPAASPATSAAPAAAASAADDATKAVYAPRDIPLDPFPEQLGGPDITRNVKVGGTDGVTSIQKGQLKATPAAGRPAPQGEPLKIEASEVVGMRQGLAAPKPPPPSTPFGASGRIKTEALAAPQSPVAMPLGGSGRIKTGALPAPPASGMSGPLRQALPRANATTGEHVDPNFVRDTIKRIQELQARSPQSGDVTGSYDTDVLRALLGDDALGVPMQYSDELINNMPVLFNGPRPSAPPRALTVGGRRPRK